MAAYSNDLRSKLILAWQRGQNTEQELADNFSVSRGWVQKVIRHWRRTKQTTAPTYRHGPLPKIDSARLAAQVEADPDATLEELAKRLRSSAPTVCRALQRLGLRRKKTLHASERDTARVEKLRRSWQRKFRRHDPKHLVFLDETGINLTLTRRYGRALPGKRVCGSVPQNYGQNVTVLGGLDRQGVRAAMAVGGPVDGAVFLTFLQQVLCPRLKPGDTV